MSYSRKRIEDEFAGMNLSRQRKWQLRKQKAGLCINCGKVAAWKGSSRCLEHVVSARERRHDRGISKERKLGAKSYRVEAREMILSAGQNAA